MKLSKTQAELLKAMQAGVEVRYMPYFGRFNPNPYFYRGDSGKRCTAAAEALRKRKLLSCREVTYSQYAVTLTDAGKAWTADESRQGGSANTEQSEIDTSERT